MKKKDWKILVVEDENDIALRWKIVLSRLKVGDFEIALTPSEGLEKYREMSPNIIFLDITLADPSLNGLDLARLWAPHAAVIFVTGEGQKYIDKVRSVPHDELINKDNKEISESTVLLFAERALEGYARRKSSKFQDAYIEMDRRRSPKGKYRIFCEDILFMTPAKDKKGGSSGVKAHLAYEPSEAFDLEHSNVIEVPGSISGLCRKYPNIFRKVWRDLAINLKKNSRTTEEEVTIDFTSTQGIRRRVQIRQGSQKPLEISYEDI